MKTRFKVRRGYDDAGIEAAVVYATYPKYPKGQASQDAPWSPKPKDGECLKITQSDGFEDDLIDLIFRWRYILDEILRSPCRQ